MLKELIRLPSFSREEDRTAAVIEHFFSSRNIPCTRVGNNVLALNREFDPAKPTLLLNSHHDTVRPNTGYARDPFDPAVENGKLYGLGSNDAGGALVALITCFIHFWPLSGLRYNIALAATAEEEISGSGGVELALKKLPPIEAALVGEPTGMEMANAERGLLVLDCVAKGIAGHTARGEGRNAIYAAIADIEWLRSYSFEKVSSLLGPVTANVTVIGTANKAHNVVPAECTFVVDLRVNELYDFDEILQIMKANMACELNPRSMRIRPTIIPAEHPLVQAGMAIGKKYFGSPTTSDKALMPFPALKMGPGDSRRSHTADEFIYVDEIRRGIEDYIALLNQVVL